MYALYNPLLSQSCRFTSRAGQDFLSLCKKLPALKYASSHQCQKYINFVVRHCKDIFDIQEAIVVIVFNCEQFLELIPTNVSWNFCFFWTCLALQWHCPCFRPEHKIAFMSLFNRWSFQKFSVEPGLHGGLACDCGLVDGDVLHGGGQAPAPPLHAPRVLLHLQRASPLAQINFLYLQELNNKLLYFAYVDELHLRFFWSGAR